MSTIVVSLRTPLLTAIELDRFVPERFAGASERDIAASKVWVGSREAALGDFFDVRGSASTSVRLTGDLSRVHGIGAGMTSGEIVVEGHAGDDLGRGMMGGRLEVRGNAGQGAGTSMGGGVLQIAGNAGDRLAAAAAGAARGMTGGEIVVSGSAGADIGLRLRRGLIVVLGDTGRDTGRAMIAGTLMVAGRVGSSPGRGNKRGSIVALGPVDIPSTYRYACTFEPPHIRLTCTYLRRRYGVVLPGDADGGRYRRYCGDVGIPGKGEILALVR